MLVQGVTFMHITYNSTIWYRDAEILLIFTLQNVFHCCRTRLFTKPATGWHFFSPLVFSLIPYDLHGVRFFRFISSFCLSPSTSANCTLSSEYLPCISFSSFSTAICLLFNSIVSCISSLMSLKLWKTNASSLCCFQEWTNKEQRESKDGV